MKKMVTQATRPDNKIQSSPKQCLTIDNESAIPFLVHVLCENLELPISHQIDPGDHFKFPSHIKCEIAVEWSDIPSMYVSDIVFLCCCATFVLTLPSAIITEGVNNISFLFFVVWSMVISVVVFLFCRPRISRPILVTRNVPKHTAFRFYQKRSFIEGMLMNQMFYDIAYKSR